MHSGAIVAFEARYRKLFMHDHALKHLGRPAGRMPRSLRRHTHELVDVAEEVLRSHEELNDPASFMQTS